MKPYSCWLLAVLATQAACTTESAAQAIAEPSVSAAKSRSELVDGPSFRLNGQPHQPTTTAELVRQLGQPDSIARGVVECGGELKTATSSAGDFWYYRDAQYEVSGQQAIISRFDVTTGRFRAQAGRLQINQHTTVYHVRRLFPVAVREAEASGRPVEAISLHWGYKGQQVEGLLNLEFAAGRLVRVELWYPC